MDDKERMCLLNAYIAEFHPREDLDARIELLISPSYPKPPHSQLPSGLDFDSPSAIFALFLGEDTWESLSHENPESENPESENPESENPESENPESENPESENPESENPESENPESENPESENPESENPESENPESKIPRRAPETASTWDPSTWHTSAGTWTASPVTTSPVTTSPVTSPSDLRYWRDTTAAEMKVFVGLLIYMGVCPMPLVCDYFEDEEQWKPVVTYGCRYHMRLTRFEQIKRLLHIHHPPSSSHQPQPGYRNRFSLGFPFLNAAIADAWRIHCNAKKQQGDLKHKLTQAKFRENLAKELCQSGKEAARPNQQIEISDILVLGVNSTE
ncbi:uncharacterized protein N7515_003801 [Penicillium bovifimosum]|uniref:PiggyBac transposable element-derived protein domain-containing protein n=1 Tax=Penicillium bovifimosum TaxID=126998 RepID=A0A9W9H5T6_9EURO|nr:uncharacterized protein N7515_003801 [Penicillium bovifimosum]KAJ5138953.1 hypothetical protein N7515_003801 [Penicillium bovifimosum]